MKKLLILSLFIFVALINSFAANRTGTIPTGQTMLSRPFTFAASDTVVTGTVTTYLISNLQKYSQNQVFTIGLTAVTGTHNMTITAYGKVAYGGSLAGGTWVQIGTPITWVTASNNGAITSTSPVNYNYFKVTFSEAGSACKALVSQFEIKTSNAYDIPASSGTLTIGRATSGTVTVQVKDDDANAAAVYRAGGTGALTLGSTDGSTTILSSGTIATTSNLTNFVAYSTDVDGRSIYGKATVSSGFNTTGPVIGAGVFGRINGASPTLTGANAYLGGTFGYYGITGTITNAHPKAGLIGVIGDVTTTADAAVLALLDGDTGTTTATAAYGVRQTNSTGASGFSYGLDLYGAAIDSYLAVAYKTADIRFSKQEVISNATDGSLIVPNLIKKLTPTTANSSATLTAIQLLSGVIKTTSTSAVAFTTPTASEVAALISGCGAGTTVDIIFDNFASSSSGVVTITLGSGITSPTPVITGTNTLTMAVNTVGKFQIYFVSATAAYWYRIY